MCMYIGQWLALDAYNAVLLRSNGAMPPVARIEPFLWCN